MTSPRISAHAKDEAVMEVTLGDSGDVVQVFHSLGAHVPQGKGLEKLLRAWQKPLFTYFSSPGCSNPRGPRPPQRLLSSVSQAPPPQCPVQEPHGHHTATCTSLSPHHLLPPRCQDSTSTVLSPNPIPYSYGANPKKGLLQAMWPRIYLVPPELPGTAIWPPNRSKIHPLPSMLTSALVHVSKI